MKKMKKNEVKVAERIRRGNFLIELKIESGWKGARNAAKRKWNMGHSNVQEHIRVSERFGSDPEQIERIETLDVPFAVLKKLACNYITDEMVDRFFELLESIPLSLRTIQNCLPLLDQVKGEFNVTRQEPLEFISDEDLGENDFDIEEPASKVSDTISLPSKPSVSFEDLLRNPSLRDPSFGLSIIQMAEAFKLFGQWVSCYASPDSPPSIS